MSCGLTAGAGHGESVTESTKEPGVMLRNGVYPIRPKRPPCAFYMKNGWCAHKANCWNNHPALDVDDVAAAAANNAAAISPTQVCIQGLTHPL